MKVKVLMLLKTFVLLVLMLRTASGVNLDEVSIDEDASHTFESISISNGTSLVVRTSLYSELCFRKTDTGGNRQTPAGSTFVVNLGETLYFRAPWVRRDSKLTYFQPSESVRDVLPAEFRTESNLILLRKRGVDYFISPSLQKAFSTNDNSVSYFKFPYQSIWRNRAEYDQWTVTVCYELRLRRRRIEERARHEREFGEALYRRLTAIPRDSNLAQALQGTVATNVQIAVTGDLTNGMHRLVQNIQVRVDGSVSGLSVCGVRFEYAANGRNIFRYRYDRAGCLRWFSSERAVPGDNGETVLADPWIFKYNGIGTLLQAFDSGPNPLLVITDRTFYFSNDDSRIRSFLDGEIEAMRDLR